MPGIDVLWTPRELARIPRDHQRASAAAVVLDVLRATSTAASAAAAGARAVLPATGLAEARRLRRALPGTVLAGEQGGLRPPGFDLGNSPSEFVPASVRGKTVILATTNGTKALVRASSVCREVYAGSWTNFTRTVERLARTRKTVLIVCAGTEEGSSLEDAYVAGAFAAALASKVPGAALTDAALAARGVYRSYGGARGALRALMSGRNGRRLAALGLGRDVVECSRKDRFPVVLRLGRLAGRPALARD